jgi:8-amino-7-oxononanoate synthase
MTHFAAQQDDLTRLAIQGRSRGLIAQRGLDFSSNDYLGLANAPALRDAVSAALARGVPVGSGGSRLLRGNHPEHEALEDEAAIFFRSESALYFSSGFAANSAVFSTLPQSGDLILYDALIHASAHEGMRLSRAECRPFRHNDCGDAEAIIQHWRREGGGGQVWIAVESLYSMDGDQAPLQELASIVERSEAILLIDEAHATGVFGENGRGLAAALTERHNIITLNTCGKALGCEGALICGPKVVRDFLINRGRGFIFSTAPSPLMAASVRAALSLLETEPERRIKLHALIAYAAEKLTPLGANIAESQIIPLILGDDVRTMAVASKLQDAGLDVRGIRPPTVPVGSSRLRISLTLNVGETEINQLADSLRAVL